MNEQGIFVALGGNMGDVRQIFRAACQTLTATACPVLAASALYQTAAIGGPRQDDYLNAVIQIQTTLEPQALLQTLRDIEWQQGRKRLEHWGPRTLDLDLIAYHDHMQTSEALTLPHPRMHERLFVLYPLRDVAPRWQHPVSGQSIATLIASLEQSEQQGIILHQSSWI